MYLKKKIEFHFNCTKHTCINKSTSSHQLPIKLLVNMCFFTSVLSLILMHHYDEHWHMKHYDMCKSVWSLWCVCVCVCVCTESAVFGLDIKHYSLTAFSYYSDAAEKSSEYQWSQSPNNLTPATMRATSNYMLTQKHPFIWRNGKDSFVWKCFLRGMPSRSWKRHAVNFDALRNCSSAPTWFPSNMIMVLYCCIVNLS